MFAFYGLIVHGSQILIEILFLTVVSALEILIYLGYICARFVDLCEYGILLVQASILYHEKNQVELSKTRQRLQFDEALFRV